MSPRPVDQAAPSPANDHAIDSWDAYALQEVRQSTLGFATGLSAFTAIVTIGLIWNYPWHEIGSLAWMGAATAVGLFVLGVFANHAVIPCRWASAWACGIILLAAVPFYAFASIDNSQRLLIWSSLVLLLTGQWLLSLGWYALVALILTGGLLGMQSHGMLAKVAWLDAVLALLALALGGLLIQWRRARLKQLWRTQEHKQQWQSERDNLLAARLQLSQDVENKQKQLEQLHKEHQLLLQTQQIAEQQVKDTESSRTELQRRWQRWTEHFPGLLVELNKQKVILTASGFGLQRLPSSLLPLPGKTVQEAFAHDDLFVSVIESCLAHHTMVADARLGQVIWRMQFIPWNDQPHQPSEGWLVGIDVTELHALNEQKLLADQRLHEQQAAVQQWQAQCAKQEAERQGMQTTLAEQQQAWQKQVQQLQKEQLQQNQQWEKNVQQLQQELERTLAQLKQQQLENKQLIRANEESELQWLERDEQWKLEKQQWEEQHKSWELEKKQLSTQRQQTQNRQLSEAAFLATASHSLHTFLRHVLDGLATIHRPHLELAERQRLLVALQQQSQRLMATINSVLSFSAAHKPSTNQQPVSCSLWECINSATYSLSPFIHEPRTVVITPKGAIPETIAVPANALQQLLPLLIELGLRGLERETLQIDISSNTQPNEYIVIHMHGVDFTPLELKQSTEINLIESPPSLDTQPSLAPFDELDLVHWRQLQTLLEELHGKSKPVFDQQGTSQIKAWKWIVPVQITNNLTMIEASSISEIRHTFTPSPLIHWESPALNGKVLLIDSNKDNRRILTFYLERLSLRVESIDAASILTWDAWPKTPDILILDDPLESQAGLERLEVLRQHYPGIPLLLVAPSTHLTLIPLKFRSELAGIISLPLDPDRLLQTLAEHLPRAVHLERYPVKITDQEVHGPVRSSLADDHECQGLLQEYVQGLQVKLADMRSALAVADLARLIRLCQDLRHSSNLYGYPQLGEQARMLQRAIMDGQDAIHIGHLLGSMQQMANRCEAGLGLADLANMNS